MQFTRRSFAFGPGAEPLLVIAHVVLIYAVMANTILAAFNLIPVPPLDGSKIWPCLFPKVKPAFSPALRQVSWILLIVVMATHALRPAIEAVVSRVEQVTPASDQQLFSEHRDAALDEMGAGRHAEAERALDQALALNPRSAECLYLRAAERAAQHKWPAAGADIRRAIELNRTNAEYQALQKAITQQMTQHE
jgi:tetratricopeptide (TPR) repeat protein